MSNLRMLCEKYIVIDDHVKELSEKLDGETNIYEKRKLLADYLKAYMDREDFKSGMRCHLIFELCEGVSND